MNREIADTFPVDPPFRTNFMAVWHSMKQWHRSVRSEEQAPETPMPSSSGNDAL